jgi:hypothetical protein
LTTNTLQLYYGRIRVGEITNIFPADETWYGKFTASITREDGPLYARILDYIEFCRNWNEQVKSNPSEPPEASDFEKFADMISTDDWSVKSVEGDRFRILDAPNFFEDRQISWRQKGT